MSEVGDILISLLPRHTEALLSGSKTVELRRRPIRVSVGGRVWIYSKLPRGAVEAIGIVQQIVETTPSRIWGRYGSVSGITKKEFDSYFAGIDVGCAIVFESILPLSSTANLSTLRKRIKNFQPPQFYKYLLPNTPELTYLRSLNEPSRRRAA